MRWYCVADKDGELVECPTRDHEAADEARDVCERHYPGMRPFRVVALVRLEDAVRAATDAIAEHDGEDATTIDVVREALEALGKGGE